MTPFDVDPVQPTGKPQWLIEAEQEELNATIDWNDPEPEPMPMAPALPELDPAELSASFGEDDGAIAALAPITEEEIAPPQPVTPEPEVEPPKTAEAAIPVEPPAPVIVEDDGEEEIEVEQPRDIEDEESMKRKATPLAVESSDVPASEPAASGDPTAEEISALSTSCQRSSRPSSPPGRNTSHATTRSSRGTAAPTKLSRCTTAARARGCCG